MAWPSAPQLYLAPNNLGLLSQELYMERYDEIHIGDIFINQKQSFGLKLLNFDYKLKAAYNLSSDKNCPMTIGFSSTEGNG